MFTICTSYVAEGKLEETLKEFGTAESIFTPDIGVLERRFFQCTTQPHIIWCEYRMGVRKAS